MGILDSIGNAVHTGLNAARHPIDTFRKGTDALGLTNPAPADLSKGPDAEALRKFSGQLVDEYTNRHPGTFERVAPVSVDRTQSDQARGVQQSTIGGLQGVASGATSTAADALLTKGTDAAARDAMGTAAAYSRGGAGQALRMGLQAGNDAHSKAAADAAMLKANEQAAARGQLVDAANAMRGQDINTSTTDANAANAGALANQNAGLTQQQIDVADANARRVSAAAALAAPLTAAQAAQQLQLQNQAANSTAIGGIISAGGKALGASDERLKTGIHDGSPDADAFLSSLAPRSYEWKDPAAHRPGEQLGVVAQELPEDDVTTGPDGKKWISADVIGKVLAGMGRLHERVVAVEGGGKGKDEDVKWGPNPYPAPAPPRPPTTGERRRG